MAFFAVVGLVAFGVFLALGSGDAWASKTILAGVWPWLLWSSVVVWIICLFIMAWHFYQVKLGHDKSLVELALLNEAVAQRYETTLMVQEARANQDHVEISTAADGAVDIKIVRREVLLEQARYAALTAAEKQAARSSLPAPSRQQLPPPSSEPSRQENEQEEEVVLPVAPSFRAMAHLITLARMPLCFVIDPSSGHVIPMFGTIDDLLSMAITGKPGRGKTVALMYYVAMLLKNGAEVYVFDPHGAMAELAILNNRVLPGMPATARIHYFDRKESITGAVPGLYRELEQRDDYYRPQVVDGEVVSRRVKHPLLVLADELPILADFDEQVEAEYKKINRQRVKDGEDELEVPSLMYLIRRIVLEARKWRCFFIGSGQSMDAEVLPTKVTENLNSRIVFFSSNRRARMSGLENDAIRHLLPQIRRGGSGVMVYDCARWDEPLIGAIPYITVDDLLWFLGVDASTALQEMENGANLGTVGASPVSGASDYPVSPRTPVEAAQEGKIVPLMRPDASLKKATYNDAVQVWNDLGGNVGRVQMQNALNARGFACGPNQARTFVEDIKKSLEDRTTGMDGCVDG